MNELEGSIDLARCEFNWRDRSCPLRVTHEVIVPARGECKVSLAMDYVPPDFPAEGKAVVYLQLTPHQPVIVMMMRYKKGIFSFWYDSELDVQIMLRQHQLVGWADMRSVGYFFVPRELLTKTYERNLIFFELTEDGKNLEKVRPKKPRIKGKKIEASEDKNPDKYTEVKIVKPEVSDKPGKRFVNGYWVDEDDEYPWLSPEDPRRTMTDEEILRSVIDLSESLLTDEEKERMIRLCIANRKAFSLRDEIGECDYVEVNLELKDAEPFFNRPYPIKEAEKAQVDNEMRKGCLLGILKKGLSSYSSPIMLITRKQGGMKRIVTDFRFLNSRLKLLQCSAPLIRDALQCLGASKANIASIIDLRDAFHTLKVNEKSQQYLGITPYFGSPTYVYQRLPMGLSVSPAIFMYFITRVLDQIEDREHYIAIMDDVFVHSKREKHWDCLETIFQTIEKNGLKISPKKLQLFRDEVVYMGLNVSYKLGHPTVTPPLSKIEAIVKITHLESQQDVKGFCGMVNFLRDFIPDLQTLMIPLYALLTKKKAVFEWTPECQFAFEEVKKRLASRPVLNLPTADGRYTLVSDTSKVATGAALYQEQEGELRLIAYHSKKLNDAASRYSISELELHGLYINIKAFDHYLRGSEFDVIVDHSALVYILKAKREPPTMRLKKLVEHLSEYHFTTKFLKGKEMYISDFLSRHTGNEKYSKAILPVSLFDSPELERYGPDEMKALTDATLRIMTRKQAKEQGVVVPDLFNPGGETPKTPQTKAKKPLPVSKVSKLQDTYLPPSVSQKENIQPMTQPQEIEKTYLPKMQPVPPVRTQQVPTDIWSHQPPALQLPRPLEVKLAGKLPKHDDPQDYRSPPEFLYKETQPLFSHPPSEEDLVYAKLPSHKHLKEQLEFLKKKVINDYNIPLTIKDLTQNIKTDPYFGEVYQYLNTGRLPIGAKSSEKEIRRLKNQAEDYVLVDKVLFKLHQDKHDNEWKFQLCIPQEYIVPLLYHYHNTILASHQGATRMYLTLREKYFAPYLMDNIRRYLVCCQTCQARLAPPDTGSIAHLRIPYDFRPMKRCSMDIKYMMKTNPHYQYILFVCCELSNYLVGIPLANKTAKAVADALLDHVIYLFGPPKQLIADMDTAFMSAFLQEIYRALKIQLTVVSPGNHGSLRVERYIKTAGDLIQKNLMGTGENWPSMVTACCYAFNTFVSTSTGISPYKLVFVQDPADLTDIHFEVNKGMTLPAQEYLAQLQERFKVLRDIVVDKKLKAQQTQLAKHQKLNLDKHVFAKGDLVYFYAPRLGELVTTSKKFQASWIGPLQIVQLLDESHCILADLNGKILKALGGVHTNMLKPYLVTLGEMKESKLVTYDNFVDLKNRTPII